MQIDVLIACVVVMAGATVQGMTGFGFGLVAVPILILFEDPRTAVATTLILSPVLNALILIRARRHLRWRDAGPITLGSLPGVPVGILLLTAVDAELLKGMVAALVLLFSVPLLLGYSRGFHPSVALSLLAGAVSGALQSSTGMGSPPVALLMANQGLPREAFRAIQVLRSMAASVLSVVALVPAGLVNPPMAAHALLLAPALLVGFALGSRLLKRVPQRPFRTATVALVAMTALISLAGTLLQ